MVKDAAENEAEDKRRREEAELRNKADHFVYSIEKTLGENKDKLQAADVAAIESAIKDCKDAMAKQDHAALQSAMDRLQKESHRIAEVMYKAAGEGPTAAGGAPPEPGEEPRPNGKGNGNGKGVIDAEFEETK